ncbi:efflux RND transporter periplasmic adaptor subunit [Pseudomonas putida]|uniref:Biotin/lipoyl-binding protein n=1 Tax=Pseudomonas putida TaxID=303 RepID=A0A7V8J1W7_PSEPU|nr:biotin/lipoyl-binding protein [Pseudomonas putida]KAF0251840.1 biotin/lipoyl-binding protein [Pseudomonas putida]MBS5848221.1 biotin/lipoyl-binding protein [Pseudomonas putida]HEN8726376.1 biotin/lipoyl-binding protein [Pseudomonas putida]
MKRPWLLALAPLGVVAGLIAAFLFARTPRPLPPAFPPASSSFQAAIYANGIIESEQAGGSDIVIFPQVAAPVTRILVHEGQAVSRDSPLVTLDDAVPRANLELAQANLAIARDQYAKRLASFGIDARSISKDALDTAKNQAAQAQAAFKAAAAELARYVIKAPSDGIVVTINSAVGSYVSPQGAYNIHTQDFNPLLVMTSAQDRLMVRCYVDEILIDKLPPVDLIQAEMTLRGTHIRVPLEFVRVQPYVTPKIELSNQRQERVDLRVLPVLFRFERKALPAVYPGQLVDVFISRKTP